MTTMTGPRPLTDAETEAWTLHLQKVPVPEIQTRTGLLPSQIAAAVDLGQVHARRAMQSSTAVLLPTEPKPTPAAQPAPAPVSNGSRELSVGQLLTWAEQSGHTRALTLAARIRTAVDELRTFHVQHDARSKAQAEVDRLTAELEAAKAALRSVGAAAAKPAAPASVPAAGSVLSRTSAIRKWAQQNGIACSTFGRIPRDVEVAYDAAQRSAA
jgi:hypothetical protein